VEFPSSLPSAHRNNPYRSKNCKEPEEIPVLSMSNPLDQTSFCVKSRLPVFLYGDMHLTHVTTAYCSEKPKLATRYSVYMSQVHTPINNIKKTGISHRATEIAKKTK